ncbi:MAG: hypothetical protein ABIZ09_19640 [Rhodoferax sp.]
MQLPAIERTPNLLPIGAEAISSGANRAIPVAPVNPPTSGTNHTSQPVASVVNMVNTNLQTKTEGEPVYTSVLDPVRHDAGAADVPQDWTIHRPTPVKVEDPPIKPLYQVLMEHIQNLWAASAGAVQLDQVHDQVTTPVAKVPSEIPGDLAKSVLVYDHNTIKKNERL